MFSISFDPASLAAIGQMYGFQTFLSDSVGIAMQQAGAILTKDIQTNTWTAFKNPTGATADSVMPVLESPYELQVSVGTPQARRLEYGFVGADSLGRVYNQAPEPYVRPAFDADQQEILQLLDQAVLDTFAKIGGGA